MKVLWQVYYGNLVDLYHYYKIKYDTILILKNNNNNLSCFFYVVMKVKKNYYLLLKLCLQHLKFLYNLSFRSPIQNFISIFQLFRFPKISHETMVHNVEICFLGFFFRSLDAECLFSVSVIVSMSIRISLFI